MTSIRCEGRDKARPSANHGRNQARSLANRHPSVGAPCLPMSTSGRRPQHTRAQGAVSRICTQPTLAIADVQSCRSSPSKIRVISTMQSPSEGRWTRSTLLHGSWHTALQMRWTSGSSNGMRVGTVRKQPHQDTSRIRAQAVRPATPQASGTAPNSSRCRRALDSSRPRKAGEQWPIPAA